MADRTPLVDLAEVAKVMQNQPKPVEKIVKDAGFPMTPPGSNPAKLVGGVRDKPKLAGALPVPVDEPDKPKQVAGN